MSSDQQVGGTIAGDSYFSAQKDIRFMLDVFTQVPLPPGVRDNEATYIANCFQSVESYFIQQRAPLLSAYVLETDPGDPRWDHSWNDLTNCLAKFKFLQDQANSLLFDSGYSAPNTSSV